MVTPETVFDPLEPIATADLEALALPWAREAEPDKAAQVETKRAHEPTFRRWCARLLELRWAQADEAWRRTVPLLALHETALVVTFRHKPTGATLVVSGRHAPKPWKWTFVELASFTRAATWRDDDAGFALLVRAKETLDLEHVP